MTYAACHGKHKVYAIYNIHISLYNSIRYSCMRIYEYNLFISEYYGIEMYYIKKPQLVRAFQFDVSAAFAPLSQEPMFNEMFSDFLGGDSRFESYRLDETTKTLMIYISSFPETESANTVLTLGANDWLVLDGDYEPYAVSEHDFRDLFTKELDFHYVAALNGNVKSKTLGEQSVDISGVEALYGDSPDFETD